MSSYAVMSEVNGRVNRSRQVNRIPKPYFEAVLRSETATDEDKEMAQKGLDQIEGFDKLLSQGYVSTGRQYDDEWCDRVEREDRYWDTLDQRFGSTAVEEAEAEIAFQIAQKRAGEAADVVEAYFTAEVTARLFPATWQEQYADGEAYEARSEFWEFPRMYRKLDGSLAPIGELRALSLQQWVSEGVDQLQMGWDEDSHGGHGDY